MFHDVAKIDDNSLGQLEKFANIISKRGPVDVTNQSDSSSETRIRIWQILETKIKKNNCDFERAGKITMFHLQNRTRRNPYNLFQLDSRIPHMTNKI